MINKYHSGESPRVNLLWLTGWSMPESVFEPLQKALPECLHDAVDYSNSDSPDAIIAVVREAVRRLDSSAPLLIAGWSLGGLLALQLAAEGYADGVIVLAGTPCLVRPNNERELGWPKAYLRQMIAALSRDRNAVLQQFYRTMFTKAELESGAAAYKFPSANEWTLPALIAGLQLLSEADIRPQLSNIDCPVLLVHGSEDQVCPYAAALELKEQLKQAELIKVADRGHVPFLGMEQQTADVIRRWWHERTNKQSHSAPV